VRDQITGKYPADRTRHFPQPAQVTSDIDFVEEATNGRVLKYIFSFKRGQAASALGWSMDYWQDVLFYHPDSIQGIPYLENSSTLRMQMHYQLSDLIIRAFFSYHSMVMTILSDHPTTSFKPFTASILLCNN